MNGWEALLSYAKDRALPDSDTIRDIVAFSSMDDAASVMLDAKRPPLARAYAAQLVFCACIAEEAVRRGRPPMPPTTQQSWDRTRAAQPIVSLDDAQIHEQLREGFLALSTIRMLLKRAV